ncbi:hypothetical protein ACFTY8_28760 [Streptomyces mirabilis]
MTKVLEFASAVRPQLPPKLDRLAMSPWNWDFICAAKVKSRTSPVP